MDTTSYIALSRQIALDRHMTTLATNIANASTTGYQARHTAFETVLERARLPRPLAFVQDAAQWRDLAPGAVTVTGNATDLAIDGPGYFAFATPEGVRYGRGGHLGIDAEGQLVAASGRPVLDEGCQPITLPAGEHDPVVAADGTVSGKAGLIARLQIAGFANPQALQPQGDGLLTTDETPQPATGARVVQGALEGANVQPVSEMTGMMQAVRLFEGTQRLLDTQHDLDRKAIDGIIGQHGR